MSSPPGPAMELLGHIAYELHQMKPLVPTYIHLLISAIFPIYTAAHASLARPTSAAPIEKKEDADITDLQDEEISPTIETLQPSDAILFPILAGTVLASLYFILKWLQDPALLNYYLGLYFAIVGLFFTIKFTKDGLVLLRSVALPSQYSYRGNLWKLVSDQQHFAAVNETKVNEESLRRSPFPGSLSILFKKRNSALWSLRRFVYTKLHLKFSILKIISIVTVVDTLDFAGLAIAAPLVAYHTFIAKPWFLTNFLGFSFCYGSLQITTPGTSWTGSLLLMALFFYDIYFVFFTPMMVTVATKLDIPIKLLFPRPDGCVLPVGAVEGSQAMEEYLQCLAKKRTMAMLGLGDIVIPGMMLAFALRFDLYMYYRKLSASARKDVGTEKSSDAGKVAYLPATGSWGERFWTSTKLRSPEMKAKQFPKTYFNASVIGYILGMITTVVVMQISQHAQPALLYLVPGVLLSIWGTALAKGDFKLLWNYSEVPQEKEIDKKKEIEDKKDQNKIQEEGDKTTNTEDTNGTENEEPEKVKQQNQDSESATAKNGSSSTTSDEKSMSTQKESNLDVDSDSQHIVYFSLSFISDRKQRNQSTDGDKIEPNPPKLNISSSSTSSSTADRTPPTESQASSDEFDISSADEQPAQGKASNTTKALPTTKASASTLKQKSGSKQTAHIPDHEGDVEPLIKRRRKA